MLCEGHASYFQDLASHKNCWLVTCQSTQIRIFTIFFLISNLFETMLLFMNSKYTEVMFY